MSGHKWTEKQLEIVRAQWGTVAVGEIAREIGVSSKTVQNAANRLGLYREDSSRLYMKQDCDHRPFTPRCAELFRAAGVYFPGDERAPKPEPKRKSAACAARSDESKKADALYLEMVREAVEEGEAVRGCVSLEAGRYQSWRINGERCSRGAARRALAAITAEG